MPKNYSPFLSVPYEVGDVLVIYRTWLPDLKNPQQETEQDEALDVQWKSFLDSDGGKPFSDEVDGSPQKKKIDFKSSRITFKVNNIYSYGVGSEVTGVVKWSNVAEWPVGSTLTFVLDDETLRNYRYAQYMFNPASVAARKRDNLWRATTETLLGPIGEETETSMREANGYNNWFRNPILNNNCEYRAEAWGIAGQEKTYSHKCARLKGNNTNFFTIEYAVQGRLIEFIKRMADKLRGRTVTKLDEMGYFTLGLRKKREVSEMATLVSDVPQEVLWSKDAGMVGSREDMDTNAYFVLSAIGVTNPNDLDSGARVATTENLHAYEVILYRSKYAVMEGSDHHLHNIKYRLRMSDDQLYGPNPHIEYMKTGDGATLHSDDGKAIKVVQEVYGFELRSHNRAQPVSSMTFNLRDKDTNAFIKPRTNEHWQHCKTQSYYDSHEGRNIDPEPQLGEPDIQVDWTAAMFIEYKPKSVYITVSDDGKPDEKHFKTIYVPTAIIREETPDFVMEYDWNSQREWGFILKDAFMKQQGLRCLDPVSRPLYYIERTLSKELNEELASEGDYDETLNIFDIIGQEQEAGNYKINDNMTAGQYYREFVDGIKESFYSEDAKAERAGMRMVPERMYEPWALRLDPDELMFKAVCEASRTWQLYGYPKYIREIVKKTNEQGYTVGCAPPKFKPEQDLEIIQLHVATMNAKGKVTKYDMMNRDGDGYTQIWGSVNKLEGDNTYMEIHIGETRTYESTRGKKDILSSNLLETSRVHMNKVSVITDAQHHTDELVSSRMDITQKLLAEYPDRMTFSMIHSVMADSNRAIDKKKMIELLEKYVPNSGLFDMENNIVHTTAIPKPFLNELILQEAGQSETMNLNQSLWDFILFVIGKQFKKNLNISDGTTLAKLRQQVYSFRLTVRDSQVQEKRIDRQQKAYTDGTLTLKINQMDEYFSQVSGITFVLEKLNTKELNKSIGEHLKKVWMLPSQLMSIGGFTPRQCINYNMEITMEPQQRRTYNAIEISMSTAVGPYISKTRQIPTNAWDQTFKPSFLRIKARETTWNAGDAAMNKFQPLNRNNRTREDIMREAGFYWDDGGMLCHMGDRVEGAEPLIQEDAWGWVKMWHPDRLLSRYEPDPLDVKALEARMTFIGKEINGQVKGEHLQETELLHESRKDIMRNTFKHVRNLTTLKHDVYRKIPRSQKKIRSDWIKYQRQQYDALRRALASMPAGTNSAYERDLHLISRGVQTPEQYESIEGNTLVGPFQSAEPYADDTGKPGQMENDFWEVTDDDIEVELNKDNYGKIGYLLNHFIRSRRCYQMDIANKWFKATLGSGPNLPAHKKYALSLEGRLNYLRWQGSGVATKVGQNGNGAWPKSATYVTKTLGNIVKGHTSKDKNDRTRAFYAEINGVYEEESQQFITHVFKFPKQFNSGIDWRAPITEVKFFSVTDMMIMWDRDIFTPRLRVQGIANIINNIIYKRYNFVSGRMRDRNKEGLDQLEQDIQLVGKSSVENLIEKVWDHYSGFEGMIHIGMEGRSDYSLVAAGFPDKLGFADLRRLPSWNEIRRLFNVKITLPGSDTAYIYENDVYVRNFFYLARVKDKNRLQTDFGKFKLEFELKCKKVLRKNYGKLMGMGSLGTYHGVDQTKAGLFLPDNLSADDKFLSKENQYDQGWRLYDGRFYSDLVALFEINGFKKTDVPIPDSYKPVNVFDPKTKLRIIGVDNKPLIKMAPIDAQTYKIMGLWRKVETLTAARATQINNSDRVQEAMGVMYDFWRNLPTIDLEHITDSMSSEQLTSHVMSQHSQLAHMEVPSDETAETALGIPFTECQLCGQPGSTVFLGRCSKNKDRPHCYHMSCLYDKIIKNPGTGGTSWQYKAINLDQEMSYITEPIGTPATNIYLNGNLTVREFLNARSLMVLSGTISREQSVIIPLEVDEAVLCAPPTNGQNRRWFINAGKNHKRTVCGYYDEQHARKDEWYKDVPMFKWRGLLAGHADQAQTPPFKNTGPYVDECRGQEYHATVTMTPNTAKCSTCQMKFGSRIMVSIPKTRQVGLGTNGPIYQYAGQEVVEYGADGLQGNIFFGEVPKYQEAPGYDWTAYKHKYVLMKYEPFGRAEVEGTGTASHGGGSLELHIHDVASYLESRPYKDKTKSILYEYDKNLPQVLYPTPRLPGMEHPLIRKRKGEGGAKRQKKDQLTKILYGKKDNLALACIAKARGKDWKDNLMVLFNKRDPTEDGKMEGGYTDEWMDSRGGAWAVYDPQSEVVQENSNSSTTKRPAETRIPGTGDVVELPVYASGPGGASMGGGVIYNSNFEANPEDIKRIERWCKLIEEQVGAVEKTTRQQSKDEYDEYVARICAKYQCDSLETSGTGLKARFTVVPPGRAVKMNMEFPNDISLPDFIRAVKKNIKPVTTKEKLSIYIPDDRRLIGGISSISELTKKWFRTPTWPQTIDIEEDMLGKVVEVPIFEQDMELEWPDYDDLTPQQVIELEERVRLYNEVKNDPSINTIQVSKIEYMGERLSDGFPKVYEGRSVELYSSLLLKDKIKKPKLRQKPEGQDQLPWFTKEMTEQFMVRTKPKQLSQQARRMKIEIAFVEEKNLDATIIVNKCDLIVDVPKDLEICFLGEYLLKCIWFQNPDCWLYKDENGHPTLPDGRKLFKLTTLKSSSTNGFIEHPEAHRLGDSWQLFTNSQDYDDDGATLFSEDLRNAKINLIGKGNEQDSRDPDTNSALSYEFDKAEDLDNAGSGQSNITFEQLINDSLAWPDDYEDDDWFWSSDSFANRWDDDKKKTYGNLGVPYPYKVSQLESRRKLEEFDPDCTKHGVTILIQVPNQPKYKRELAENKTYEWGNGDNRVKKYIAKQEGAGMYKQKCVVANVTFHDYNGQNVALSHSVRAAIPINYLVHADGEDPDLPQTTDGDRWIKLYNWSNLLSGRGRVFADDRFYIPGVPLDYAFNGDASEGDRFWVDMIGERGEAETLAIVGGLRILQSDGTYHLKRKKLLLAHQSTMAREFYTVIKKVDDSHFGRTYEEKYDVMPVSALLPMLRSKTKIIPLSAFTQSGIKIRYPELEDNQENVDNMIKQMGDDGVNVWKTSPNEVECLIQGQYNLAGGWSNALTDGIMQVAGGWSDDPLKHFDGAHNQTYTTALLTGDQEKELMFNRKYDLFIDLIRSPPRPNAPAVAPTRTIGFDFVVVGPHSNRNERGYFDACGHEGFNDNTRHFRGGEVHKMFLPVEKNIQGGPGSCGFGFKDIHWHDFLQELPNVFCAEIARDTYGWKLEEKRGEDWVMTDLEAEERIKIFLEEIEYVGTMILRDDRDSNTSDGQIKQVELFHLSPNRPTPYGSRANFKLSIDEQEFVSLGIDPMNNQIPHSKLYVQDVGNETGVDDTAGDYLNKKLRAAPTSVDEIKKYAERTNGCMVGPGDFWHGQASNLIFNPLNWTAKEENRNVYLSRACGVFKQSPGSRTLPLNRGISRDGTGYNIQRALFGINNSIDGWRNPCTSSDFNNGILTEPHFVIGVRLKNPDKYRLTNRSLERVYDFNKAEPEPEPESEEESSSDDDTVDNGNNGDNVYNLAIDANSSQQISNNVMGWPVIIVGDIVHCAYPNPVYRVVRKSEGYVNLEQVEDPSQTVEDYPVDDLTFIHRAVHYPSRLHETIRTRTYCRVRLGSFQAPGSLELQALCTPWSGDDRYSEQIFRIERFGFGSRDPLNYNVVNEDEALGDDEAEIGETHQIVLRDMSQLNAIIMYRTFISVIAYCDNSALRIFGPPDENDSDDEEAAQEDIMGEYTYENSDRSIKIGDIVMYQPHSYRTMVRTGLSYTEGTRFNVEDPREYSVVDIIANGDATTFIIKLNMWTKLWDRALKKSERMIDVMCIQYIQFKREGYNPITIDTAVGRWITWRQMPNSVGTLVRRVTTTGAYLDDNTYIVTGITPDHHWTGHNDGTIVQLIEGEIVGTGGQYGDHGVYIPKTGEDATPYQVNTKFLRWSGYQGVYHSNNYFTIGSKWNLMAQGATEGLIHEVIAVHREYLGQNDLTGQIDMREQFNGLVVRSTGPHARIETLDLDNYNGTIMRVDPGLYSYNDLIAKDWPIYEPWEDPQDSASSTFTSESEEDELDSRLSKITLKF